MSRLRHSLLPQFVEHIDQVSQRSTQAVNGPNTDLIHLASNDGLEQILQALPRAPTLSAGNAAVGKDPNDLTRFARMPRSVQRADFPTSGL
jgi:hypothetical protein